MEHLLITGGAGFIGSHLAEVALRARFHVSVVDDLSSGRRSFVPTAAKFYKLDVCSPKLAALFMRLKPTYVCHLAAQSSVPRSQADPAHDAEVNIVGSLNVCRAVMQAGAKKLLYTSSAAVYGEPATIPTGEAEALDPRSPYALSKHTVERYLEYFSHSVGLASVVVRPANVYGPRAGTAGEGGVVSVFARSLTTGTPLTIHGHGDQTRDYIYVTDVAQGMLKAIEQGNGAYNLGTGHDISIRELVVRFGEVVGTVPRVDYAAARPHDIKRSALSPRRAERELGWKSQVPLTEGLRLTLKWFKDNPKYL